MNTAKHASTFELDVYYASSATEREQSEVAEHVASCPRCRAYVEELAALSRERPSPQIAQPQRQRRVAVAAGVIALAACIMLYLRSRPTAEIDDAGYVGVKGVPAAQVL